MTDPLLAALLKERFAKPSWWTARTYRDDDLQVWLRKKELAAAINETHRDDLTGLLPDQEDEVA